MNNYSFIAHLLISTIAIRCFKVIFKVILFHTKIIFFEMKLVNSIEKDNLLHLK